MYFNNDPKEFYLTNLRYKPKQFYKLILLIYKSDDLDIKDVNFKIYIK